MGSREVDEDGGEARWWPHLTKEDRSSFKGAKTKTTKQIRKEEVIWWCIGGGTAAIKG